MTPLPNPGSVEVGQVWASTHRGDIARGDRQCREVVRVDDRYAHLITVTRDGQRLPVTRVLRSRKGITGHRRIA